MPERPANARQGCLKSHFVGAGLALWMLLTGPVLAESQSVPSTAGPPPPLDRPAPTVRERLAGAAFSTTRSVEPGSGGRRRGGPIDDGDPTTGRVSFYTEYRT